MNESNISKTSEYFKKNFSLLQSIGKQTNLNDGDTSIIRSTLTIDECQANSKLYKVIFSLPEPTYP